MLAGVMLLAETVVPLTRPRCEWLEMRPGSTVLTVSLMMVVLGGGLMALLVTGWVVGWASRWPVLSLRGRASRWPEGWAGGASGWPAPALIAVIFDPVMRMSACSIGGAAGPAQRWKWRDHGGWDGGTLVPHSTQ